MNNKPFAAFTCGELKGLDVRNAGHVKLGSIDEIVLSNSGRVAYIVLSHGGILGSTIADKRFAVPFDAFTFVRENEILKCILNVDKEQLANAPGFTKDNVPHLADASFSEKVDAYYEDYVRSHHVV